MLLGEAFLFFVIIEAVFLVQLLVYDGTVCLKDTKDVKIGITLFLIFMH